MPAEGPVAPDRSALLLLGELAHIAWLLCDHLSIQSIKLTGDEPLVRAGLLELAAKLASLPGSPEISMTTNGTLLRRFAAGLKYSGLAGNIKVSLFSGSVWGQAGPARRPARQESSAGLAVRQERLGHVDAKTTLGDTHLMTVDDVRVAEELEALVDQEFLAQDLPKLVPGSRRRKGLRTHIESHLES